MSDLGHALLAAWASTTLTFCLSELFKLWSNR